MDSAVSYVDDIIVLLPVELTSQYLEVVAREALKIGLALNKAKSGIVPLHFVMKDPHLYAVLINDFVEFIRITVDALLLFETELKRRTKKTTDALNRTMADIRYAECKIHQ